MKLSEAIREGAKLKPQAFGDFFLTDAFDEEAGEWTVTSCALGAAAEAVQRARKLPVLELYSIAENLPEYFDILTDEGPSVSCPAEGCEDKHTLFNIIALLNDSHKWSREQIAAWVEQFETTNA